MRDQTQVEVSIHNCTGFRVARYFPDINNAITVEVTTATGIINFLMFGQELAITDKLMGNFGDEDTLVSRHSPLPLTNVAGDAAA